jgi:transcriptional regulator with XRE-family HTH domain
MVEEPGIGIIFLFCSVMINNSYLRICFPNFLFFILWCHLRQATIGSLTYFEGIVDMVYDFGYRLRDLRAKKRLTQTQVAKRLNLSKATISGYENNIKTPSIDVLIQLSALYGTSTDYILGLETRKMVMVEGLSETQQEILNALVDEFRQEET